MGGIGRRLHLHGQHGIAAGRSEGQRIGLVEFVAVVPAILRQFDSGRRGLLLEGAERLADDIRSNGIAVLVDANRPHPVFGIRCEVDLEVRGTDLREDLDGLDPRLEVGRIVIDHALQHLVHRLLRVAAVVRQILLIGILLDHVGDIDGHRIRRRRDEAGVGVGTQRVVEREAAGRRIAAGERLHRNAGHIRGNHAVLIAEHDHFVLPSGLQHLVHVGAGHATVSRMAALGEPAPGGVVVDQIPGILGIGKPLAHPFG